MIVCIAVSMALMNVGIGVFIAFIKFENWKKLDLVPFKLGVSTDVFITL